METIRIRPCCARCGASLGKEVRLSEHASSCGTVVYWRCRCGAFTVTWSGERLLVPSPTPPGE
ncbi:hypothetical protein [Microtetraspora sp. NBRC 13810]|uniref:hypothetical protein n=1 Tax=Microtetraspora sp. NBRC 13810 TaxID=3030990 RepID=UPI002553DBB4|nr:hypothetical protein [Microtetraspora sp. NBRC 13810]